ncbi:MAG: hypothetical protein KDA93_01635 [Planctomycetaceae bacterium]|nr:hypothetical protein [Planctomycetaceae bacterium]
MPRDEVLKTAVHKATELIEVAATLDSIRARKRELQNLLANHGNEYLDILKQEATIQHQIKLIAEPTTTSV